MPVFLTKPRASCLAQAYWEEQRASVAIKYLHDVEVHMFWPALACLWGPFPICSCPASARCLQGNRLDRWLHEIVLLHLLGQHPHIVRLFGVVLLQYVAPTVAGCGRATRT